MKRIIFLVLYYGFAQYLPDSYLPIIGEICNKIRIICVKQIAKNAERLIQSIEKHISEMEKDLLLGITVPLGQIPIFLMIQ